MEPRLRAPAAGPGPAHPAEGSGELGAARHGLLSAAVIGCGRMGAFTSPGVREFAPACWFPLSHAEAIAAHPLLRLRAMCDVESSNLARAAHAHSVTATYTDPALLFAEVRPALVGIATRTLGRAALILDAVASGTRALHVEKPLCNSVAELAALKPVLQWGDVFVTLGAVRRFFSVYQQAKALADSGRYGALREIRVNLGSAALYWTHPHSIDLILFAAGEARHVVGVQARLAEVEHGHSALDVVSDPRVVSASVYFDDGVVGHIGQALGADLVLSCAEAEIIVRADGAALEVYATPPGAAYPVLRPFEGGIEPTRVGGTLGPVSQLVACLEGDELAQQANARVRHDILLGQQIAFDMVQSHLQGSRIVEPGSADLAMFVHARTGGRYA